MHKIYLKELNTLANVMNRYKPSPFINFAKVIALTTMNMRYEKVATKSNLTKHPYLLTKEIIKDSVHLFEMLVDINFIESDDKNISTFKSRILEEKHLELWQKIWTRHSDKEFQEFIDLKAYRLDINDIIKYIKGSDCVDFGCGNGAFSFALLMKGGKSVTGIDFGAESIIYARKYAKKKKLEKKVTFKIDDVTCTSLKSNNYDFAVSNGVFHHLKKEKIICAVKEVARVLKKGGWFWYYVNGSKAISMELWDKSAEILRDVDIDFIQNILTTMNVRRNKIVILTDGMNATYIYSSYKEVISLLSSCGFGNFKRLIGGTSTDFDPDMVNKDPYKTEKYGEGHIRLICQLVKK